MLGEGLGVDKEEDAAGRICSLQHLPRRIWLA